MPWARRGHKAVVVASRGRQMIGRIEPQHFLETTCLQGQESQAALPGTVPDPPAVLHITPATWKAGAALHRVHLDVYAAQMFNPGIQGNARFSPIVTAAGLPIPTLYGGSSFHCAVMETVFHDVPFTPRLKTYAKHRLERRQHSVLVPSAALTLADLLNVPLRKLGVERKQLIDTEKDTGGQIRKWAAAIDAQHARIQGLCGRRGRTTAPCR